MKWPEAKTSSRSDLPPASKPLEDAEATGLTLRTLVVDDPAEIQAHVPAWERLAERALEPNVFQEPWFVLPAVAAFGGGKRLRFVLVYDETSGSARELAGVFLVEFSTRYRGLPIGHYRLWLHDQCFAATPLVCRQRARACLAAFLDWLRDDGQAHFMSWDLVAGDGPVFQQLSELWSERHLPTFLHFVLGRAILRPRENAEAYLSGSLSARARKDLRRRERRLAEKGGGAIEHRSLDGAGDVEAWVDRFLEIEASGWKGRQGTAMSSSPATRDFFRGIATEAARRKRLAMHALHVGSRPVAMQCDLLAHDGAFSYKVAYDETYASCAPGVLLEIENVRRLHAPGAPRWMDSCAMQGNALSDRLWIDRRSMVFMVAANGRLAGNLAVCLLPALRLAARLVSRRAGTHSTAAAFPSMLEEFGALAEPIGTIIGRIPA